MNQSAGKPPQCQQRKFNISVICVKSPETADFGIFPESDSLGFFHPKVTCFTQIGLLIFLRLKNIFKKGWKRWGPISGYFPHYCASVPVLAGLDGERRALRARLCFLQRGTAPKSSLYILESRQRNKLFFGYFSRFEAIFEPFFLNLRNRNKILMKF